MDTVASCGDPCIPISRGDLFVYAYNNSRSPIQMNNTWRLDLGRLVIFVNVGLIRAMSKGYILDSMYIYIENVFCWLGLTEN